MLSYKDELICDLAEYYHIHDISKYSISFLGTLIIGLDDGSRVKRAMNGYNHVSSNTIQALLLDLARVYIFKAFNPKVRYTEPSVLDKKVVEKEVKGFVSIEEFEKERRRIIES